MINIDIDRMHLAGLPYDCWELVFNELDIISQLRLRNTSWSLKCLEIADLYNIHGKVKWRLNDNIIMQFPKLKKLKAFHKITS